jgi:hypothetical protein
MDFSGVDDPKLASLLKLFYPKVSGEDIDTLVGISREKPFSPTQPSTMRVFSREDYRS